nr:LpqB family beta-propeller domain-containing protein [Galbitalea soli]
MQAATSSDSDYAIARLFLTKDAARSWDPNASVLIREAAPLQTSEPGDIIDYSVVTRASVTATGVYTEDNRQATADLAFGFTKVDGQWRISKLRDGIVLSRQSFAQVFSENALYFFDPSYSYLVPDVRWFPARIGVQSRIVTALLGGPATGLQQGATVSAFPQGTQVGSAVEVRAGLAVVDLSDDVNTASNTDKARMLQQLDQSLGLQATITVKGAPIAIADAAVPKAILPTAANPSELLRRGAKFGFEPGLRPIGRISAQVVAADATAVTLGRDQSTAALLGRGGVLLASDDLTSPRLLDTRPGLIPPSIDPQRYVWSVPHGDATAIRAYSPDGIAHTVATSGLPQGSTIVALAVSRDGTRVALYLETNAGPRLVVAGILRHDSVPASLGDLVDLPVSSAAPLDATWMDDRTVATLASGPSGDTVTAYEIGGPSTDLGVAEGARRIVGGNGQDQLRVLTDTGAVLQVRASGWQSTGITASVLATQQ